MGCGASKRTTTVVPVTETEAMISTSTIPAIGRRTSAVIPLIGEDLPGEVLDNSGDFSKHNAAYAQPLAFEVPVSTDSLIRRHPPKRLQRLEDNQLPLTHKLLDERQAEAEQRRLQILNQRVQSAKQRIPRRNFMEINDLPQDEIIETVKQDNSSSLEL